MVRSFRNVRRFELAALFPADTGTTLAQLRFHVNLMAPGAKGGEEAEAAETQQQPFTEDEVSQLHEKIRALVQQ